MFIDVVTDVGKGEIKKTDLLEIRLQTVGTVCYVVLFLVFLERAHRHLGQFGVLLHAPVLHFVQGKEQRLLFQMRTALRQTVTSYHTDSFSFIYASPRNSAAQYFSSSSKSSSISLPVSFT